MVTYTAAQSFNMQGIRARVYTYIPIYINFIIRDQSENIYILPTAQWFLSFESLIQLSIVILL